MTAGRLQVLVAEDSATQAEALRHLLESHDFGVTLARSGDEALQLLARQPIDLVVSDVLMPGLDGYELCRRIRAEPATARLPVILLTTLSEPLDIGRALAAGASTYVMKPYQPDVLLARVRAAHGAQARPAAAPAALELAGGRFPVGAGSAQILDVLAASLEDLARANRELQLANEERAAQLVREQQLRVAAEAAMRERAESLGRLEASEARFRGLAASSVIGVIAGNDRAITDANDGFLGLIGASAEDVAGGRLELRRITPPEYAERDERAQTEMRERGSCTPYEKEFLRADGSRVPVLVGGALVAREPFGWVSFVLDMSARRRAEEQLRHAQRIDAVGKLAGGVAHEVNNMMTAVIGFGGFVLRGLGDAHPQSPDVREIVAAATRAAGISHSLLAFTRQQIFQVSLLDLNEVVRDATRILDQVLGADRRLVARLAPELPPVLGDRSQLNQVLMNLALNARDAMDSGGRLTIATTTMALDRTHADAHPAAEIRQGNYVLLTVSDTGRGMDARTRDRVFEPFYTTKPVGEGTGLGLSTVYGIVKQSEGYVWIYSEVGHGTTVKVYLPVAVVPGRTIAPPPPTEPPPPCGTERVLVIEDEALVLMLAGRILRDLGYSVREAADGPAAIAMLERTSEPPDLVLCDVVMPGMSGAQVGERLAELRPELPVVYMSGYSGDDVAQRGLLPPGQPFLAKPFTAGTLAVAVRRVLDARTGSGSAGK